MKSESFQSLEKEKRDRFFGRKSGDVMIVPSAKQELANRETEIIKAWNIINEVYIACLVISVIYLAMGLFEGTLLMMEGVLIGALGIVLLNQTSRAAAILLISMGLITFSNSMVSWLGIVDFGERNILLASIAIWCGIRALKATLLIRGTPK